MDRVKAPDFPNASRLIPRKSSPTFSHPLSLSLCKATSQPVSYRPQPIKPGIFVFTVVQTGLRRLNSRHLARGQSEWGMGFGIFPHEALLALHLARYKNGVLRGNLGAVLSLFSPTFLAPQSLLSWKRPPFAKSNHSISTEGLARHMFFEFHSTDWSIAIHCQVLSFELASLRGC